LYSALKIIKKNAEGMMAKGDFAGAQKNNIPPASTIK